MLLFNKFNYMLTFFAFPIALLNFFLIRPKMSSPQNCLSNFSAPTNERSEISIMEQIS